VEVPCGLDHGQRRADLTARHGPASPVPAAAALRLLGVRAQVHPRDAKAFAYRDRAAAEAWAASTAAHCGVTSLGLVPAEGLGWVGAYDLRPALLAHWTAATDPQLPDDWTPPRRPGR
jgi:hypothetical protein